MASERSPWSTATGTRGVYKWIDWTALVSVALLVLSFAFVLISGRPEAVELSWLRIHGQNSILLLLGGIFLLIIASVVWIKILDMRKKLLEIQGYPVCPAKVVEFRPMIDAQMSDSDGLAWVAGLTCEYLFEGQMHSMKVNVSPRAFSSEKELVNIVGPLVANGTCNVCVDPESPDQVYLEGLGGWSIPVPSFASASILSDCTWIIYDRSIPRA